MQKNQLWELVVNFDFLCLQGDSGGPMTVGSTLYGITSWGPNACTTGTAPSVYARVGAYTNWICSNTNGNVYGC